MYGGSLLLYSDFGSKYGAFVLLYGGFCLRYGDGREQPGVLYLRSGVIHYFFNVSVY